MFKRLTTLLFPFAVLLLVLNTKLNAQEFDQDEYNLLRKNLCCYKDTNGNPIDFTKDTYSVKVSDQLNIEYASAGNIFTYEQKVDTMFFMNSLKLTKFLEAVVHTLNQGYARKLPVLTQNIVFNYNGHKIELRYRTRKLDFQIKNIDDGRIAFINWSGGFVLKTRGFRDFMHRAFE